jgi:hypothetical protein
MLLEAGSAYSPNLYPPDLANADVVGGPDGHDWVIGSAIDRNPAPALVTASRILSRSLVLLASLSRRVTINTSPGTKSIDYARQRLPLGLGRRSFSRKRLCQPRQP